MLKETLCWNYVASQDVIWDKVQREAQISLHTLAEFCVWIYWEKVGTHFITDLCILHLRTFNFNKMQLLSILNFVPSNSTLVCLQKFAATNENLQSLYKFDHS